MQSVAVIGHVTRDLVDGGDPRIGGAPWYGGLALRRLAIRAHVGVKCGPSDRDGLVRSLAANGLPVVATAAGETTSFRIDHDGDARRMEVLAVGEPWSPDEAVRAAADARWLHLGALFRGDFRAETLAALARERHLLLDGQGLVRIPEIGPLRVDAAFDRALLRFVTALKLAEDEAVALVGSTEPDALAELEVPELIVTLGARGCLVRADGRVSRLPAHVLEVADTTGAGDAFSAAYVAARSEGHAPASAARHATSVAAAVLG